MIACIALEGMEFYAYHGCFEEEQVVGTHFRVDVWIDVDIQNAHISDDISQTISYLDVYQLVSKEMKTYSKLLEHVGNRIIHTIVRTFPRIEKITVKVSKKNPPLGGPLNSASITLTHIV